MATAPMKSQPLHNFSFPFLKWGTTTTTTTTTTTITNHHSPNNNNSSEPDSNTTTTTTNNNHNNNNNNNTSEPDSTPTRVPPPRVGSRSSRPHRSTFSSFLPKPLKEEEEEQEEEEEVQKPWKLRPRKAVVKNEEVVVHHETVMALPVMSSSIRQQQQQQQRENLEPKSMRLRGLVEGGEKKEKTKFWIALSRDEIEEDIFIMTGSRPARRPRKRTKIVQKQLDTVFPGLWLVGATADSYRVNDPPVKR